MGTVIGIDVRDPDVPDSAVDDAVAWLTDVDARFSPYRAGSEISRLARAEIGTDDCAPDVRFVLTRCEALRLESAGFFDIRGAGLIGGLDPSGFVKGWSVEEAAFILEAAGARNYAINAGGDVILRGRRSRGPEPGPSCRPSRGGPGSWASATRSRPTRSWPDYRSARAAAVERLPRRASTSAATTS